MVDQLAVNVANIFAVSDNVEVCLLISVSMCLYIRDRYNYKQEGSFMSNATTVIAQIVGANSFAITTSTDHQLVLSGLPENQGPRPMEMLLAALAGCAGVGILDILRKMNQQVTNYEIQVDGEKAETHPRVYTRFT